MTRKGAEQRPWTTAEIEYLLANAGIQPIEEIATALGRTVWATREQWRRYKALGSTTRTDRRPVCSSCFQRHSYMKDGVCCICLMKNQLATLEKRCSEELVKLPAEDKERYARRESQRGSQVVPPPKAPNTLGMTKKQKRLALIRWEKQCEAAHMATLKRRVKATQKRLERIRKKQL